MSATEALADSPTRSRTRNAILSAAVTVLSANPAAPLGEVADAANVARSTLHRYFPERADLLEAMNQFAAEELEAATRRARLDQGTAAEALIRLCHEYFDQWDKITLIYMESLKQDVDECTTGSPLDPGLTQLIERGHADGTIDPAIPNSWLQQMLWALLYSAWEYIGQGQSRHEALSLVLRSLRKLMSPVGN